TLGIMTALGGFVDFGQIVFTVQAGALFGYALLWSVVLGTVAILVYMDMAGRLAAVAREPLFAVVRTKLGKRGGYLTLACSNLLNVITCAAELGGVAIALQMLLGWDERLLIVLATGLLALFVRFARFQIIERTFGLWGLLMIVFAVAAMKLGPQWRLAAGGLLPMPSGMRSHGLLLYAYFAVGIFSAVLMEYEVQFYSAGALEEDWTPDDLGENRMVATIGSVAGAALTAALVLIAAEVLLPRRVFPNSLAEAVSPVGVALGPTGLKIALLGTLACVGSAAIETALCSGYNLCEFLNLPWGMNMPARQVPTFTWTWLGVLGVGMVVALTGVSPLSLVNISVIFAMVIMPF